MTYVWKFNTGISDIAKSYTGVYVELYNDYTCVVSAEEKTS